MEVTNNFNDSCIVIGLEEGRHGVILNHCLRLVYSVSGTPESISNTELNKVWVLHKGTYVILLNLRSPYLA